MNAVTSLRDQSNESPFPASSLELGWWGVLPPIDRAGKRWWLPLSDAAMVAIATAISASDAQWDNSNPLVARRVTAAFLEDPPLLLFALLRWPGDDFVSVTELAEWFIGAAPGEFSAGEWIVSAPRITKMHQHRWSRLLARSRTTEPKDWIASAAEWLQVLGPVVESDWIERLPAVIWDGGSEPKPKLEGSRLLQRLARARERELATENSLSELAETRKLAAAKQLAYGLSHEINNPLANISARAQQLVRDEADPQRQQSLQQIVQQVYRAHEMIAGLMFFANPPETNRERIDLNELVREAGDEFRSIASDVDIRLMVETLADPACVMADRAMMLEAIRVLLRNSIEAIGSGGTVVLSMEREEAPSRDPQWLIHIADSGPGLSVEASRHAFDPFYSGREAGRGLGLGLCRAYRVAQLHDATIRLSGGLAGCVATIAISE
ncbi:sensor histidine kinase [Rhodopirellula sp. JC639]|uniref:sensor histidine kinase n=1 Tax=Stieleria mannarensis TaxID=2755585 RepID=UPI001603A34B|nr:HAMP domain-containing sensor histidine kinase [Rhodopirellula sp. JC639]